ncbi:MAG: hypothetical protein K6C32_03785, partial [Bacilli bacterium]|nr:hypothetical protein [Bacilli bacterium]
MKKISKLTFAALLTLGLGFTACGGTDVPSYDPVERIAINSLTGYAVVGDVIDLDEYIKVFGGAGPTDFTVTVRENSKDIVSVEGHKITILKEGEFQLDIKAGEQSGVFTGNAIAKLKNELDKLFRQVKKASKWALAYSDIDEEGNVVLTGEKAVHAKNYFIDSHDEQDENYDWICGGLLVAGDGKTYGFEADDADGTNINVLPGALSNFSNYFCNMGLAVDVSKFVVETEELEDGTTYEYLSLSTEYPSTKYSDYFSSKVDEIACSFFGNGMSDYEEMGAV